MNSPAAAINQDSQNQAFGLVLSEMGLALLVALGVYALFSRISLPLLGQEPVWFALGWFFLLGPPAGLRFWKPLYINPEIAQTLGAEACSRGAFILGGIFLGFLAASSHLGNYKLWLGLVYLGGITLRLAGLSLNLRTLSLTQPDKVMPALVLAWGISTSAGFLLLPWVRVDLVSQPLPGLAALFSALAGAALWGLVAAMSFLVWQVFGGSRRMAWLVFLAMGMGPGPTFAISWFPLWGPAAGVILLLLVWSVKRWLRKPQAEKPAAYSAPLTLYWLLRAMLLFWLGCGLLVALAAAWWFPNLDHMFRESLWLQALALGGFLVLCAGVLAEYSLPLLGRERFMHVGRDRKVLGVMLSAMALLAAFVPVLFTPAYQKTSPPSEFFGRSRRELTQKTVVLSPSNPVVNFHPPSWLSGLTHVFVISQLSGGSQVKQGTVMAQLEIMDDLGILYVDELRAGIDTADGDLARRGSKLPSKHGPARLAASKLVYAPTGEAYTNQQYFTGLFLGREVRRIRRVRLRYMYKGSEDPPVKLKIHRVFVY